MPMDGLQQIKMDRETAYAKHYTRLSGLICEHLRCQAGQWELAVALFEKLSSSDLAPDVPIFNSMIAACAHGGGYARARALFDAMPAHGCQPDAVTFANLIRAYKKGGQWCADCFYVANPVPSTDWGALRLLIAADAPRPLSCCADRCCGYSLSSWRVCYFCGSLLLTLSPSMLPV